MRLKFIFLKVLHTVIGETLVEIRGHKRKSGDIGNQGTTYLFLYILTVYIKKDTGSKTT